MKKEREEDNNIPMEPAKTGSDTFDRIRQILGADFDPKSAAVMIQAIYKDEFDSARKEFTGSDIPDEVFERLASYIESGCATNLSSGEQMYIEMLSLVNSMRRKYGRTNVMRFLQKSPYCMSYANARKMYEESINLFYSDTNVEKKAMRELKAQQLEDAAESLLAVAQSPKDYEVYERLVMSSAKLRQLDQPDPVEIPKATYQRPFKFYTLDPVRIGIDRPDRATVARQIDSISNATEMEKRRARQDAGIEDVNIGELIDAVKEESQRHQ